jgi:hypothetical protein
VDSFPSSDSLQSSCLSTASKTDGAASRLGGFGGLQAFVDCGTGGGHAPGRMLADARGLR